MSDDSNDVVMVENTGESSRQAKGLKEDLESRPIMKLFQQLISSNNKQNTVLTNAQIIAILQKEFGIDINTLHELEVDIYLNVVKRFLKDWPQWDEFDQGINLLRKKNAHNKIRRTLEEKYKDLKSYLKTQIDDTKPLAQEAVRKIIEENAKRMEQVDTSDLILEVYCTRKQLNELILSSPISGDNVAENTIFNLSEFKPTSITVNKLPLEAILNWFKVQVTVDAKYFFYQRTTHHQLKHVLVNSKNGPRNPKRDLKTQIQIKESKESKKGFEEIDKATILSFFDNVKKQLGGSRDTILTSFVDIVKSDLNEIPSLRAPAMYRQITSKYPYYRKLRKQVESNESLAFDLYIEETIAPMHMYTIGKTRSPKKDDPINFTVECLECSLKFTGVEMYALLREHFDMYHSDEPDWVCSNCEKSFAMTALACNVWRHVCTKK